MAAAVAAPLSPSTSPRLPSPPPFPEVQIGPKSPGRGPTGPPSSMTEDPKPPPGPLRRIRPGTKAADITSGPPLIPLQDLDTPFQLQEHLAALYHHHTQNTSTSPPTTQPISHSTAKILATPPPRTDAHLWLYELCRFLVIRANDLLVAFFQDTPPCSSATCPEMRASEWQYLCAVHDPPKSCCAIDYCCHTLDWAANMLTSQKQFPSRLSLGAAGGSQGGEQGGLRHLTNIMRRVYRIFAHAWFQHRGVFWEVEGRMGLYVFFKTVCDVHGLIEPANYTVPAEAEGSMSSSAEKSGSELPGAGGEKGLKSTKETKDNQGPILQRRDQPQSQPSAEQGQQDPASTTTSTGATTRRHKHTPSTGVSVAPIAETEDEEAEEEARKEKERREAKDTTGAGEAEPGREKEEQVLDHPPTDHNARSAPQRVSTAVLAPNEEEPTEGAGSSSEEAEKSGSSETESGDLGEVEKPQPQPGVAEHEPVVEKPDEVGVEPDDGLEKTSERAKEGEEKEEGVGKEVERQA